jgi:hypothetical protein
MVPIKIIKSQTQLSFKAGPFIFLLNSYEISLKMLHIKKINRKIEGCFETHIHESVKNGTKFATS